MMAEEIYICSLCDERKYGWGNNPYPLCELTDYDSRCCDQCDVEKVLPARLKLSLGTKKTQAKTRQQIQKYLETLVAQGKARGLNQKQAEHYANEIYFSKLGEEDGI